MDQNLPLSFHNISYFQHEFGWSEVEILDREPSCNKR